MSGVRDMAKNFSSSAGVKETDARPAPSLSTVTPTTCVVFSVVVEGVDLRHTSFFIACFRVGIRHHRHSIMSSRPQNYENFSAAYILEYTSAVFMHVGLPCDASIDAYRQAATGMHAK